VVTIVTDIRVPATTFPLGRILQEYPEIELELERLVPTRNAVIPLFWVTSEDEDAVEETLRGDPLVEEVKQLTRTPDRTLYAVNWSPEVDGLIRLLVDLSVDVLSAEGTANVWEFRLQFRNRTRLSQFRQACMEAGIALDLVQLYNPMMPAEKGPLSSGEHDILATAYENGYFDVPRQITQQELAALIGVGETAVSEELRTAVKLVVEKQLYGPGGQPHL
jgi:predicted DNA binding protein